MNAIDLFQAYGENRIRQTGGSIISAKIGTSTNRMRYDLLLFSSVFGIYEDSHGLSFIASGARMTVLTGQEKGIDPLSAPITAYSDGDPVAELCEPQSQVRGAFSVPRLLGLDFAYYFPYEIDYLGGVISFLRKSLQAEAGVSAATAERISHAVEGCMVKYTT